MNTDASSAEVVVAHFSELAPSSLTRFVVGDHVIAVARIADDLYAFGDVCSHSEVSLSEGTLWDDELEVECGAHGASFSITTGKPCSFPATLPIPIYQIRREDDDVIVTLPSAAELTSNDGSIA